MPFIVVFLLLAACQNKKRVAPSVTVVADSIIPVAHVEDTLLLREPAEVFLPPAGYETFNDFIYAFASNKDFQKSRIVFPLPYYKEDIPLRINKSEWKHDDFFMDQNYYTILLNSEDELDAHHDTTQTSVQVEWIYMKTNMVKKYYFERVNGRWVLEAINYRPIVDKKRIDFVDFFVRFSEDSVFQAQHVRAPLEFVTTDPDDDFAILETTLDVEQWLAFRPPLPDDKLFNIIYGQEPENTSPYKILQLKGVGNGFINTLFFRLKSNRNWELYKFEDTSN